MKMSARQTPRLLLAGLLLGWATTPAHADVPSDTELEAAHARIGDIHIQPLQVFDTRDPADNKAIFRAANRLHILTREKAIRAQLLFRTGQAYSRRILQETERNLRLLDFIREPRIFPVAYHDGVVDIEVITQDVWTLQPGFSLSRSGGANRSSVEFADQNLFGTGKALEFGRMQDVDRTSDYIVWRDPNVWGSRWTDSLRYASNDDGNSWRVLIQHPFYSIATLWSGGALLSQTRSNLSRYSLGERYDSYERAQRDSDLWLGRKLSDGDIWTQHLTVGYRVADAFFAPMANGTTLLPLPEDRALRYPYLRYDLVQDSYNTAQNLDQIARTEDLHYGWSATALAGWALRSMDSDRSAHLYELDLAYGLRISERQSTFFTSSWSARLEQGATHNSLLTADARYYLTTSERTKLYVHMHGDLGHDLDGDNYLELGGDNGLRGYPLRYQQGSSRALLTVEERFYSDWYLFRLLHVGAAAFVDAGRTWGSAPVPTPQLGWQRDVGVGLRFGNSRTSFGNVIHVDLASPLDGDPSISKLQLLFGTEVSF
ncbi:MAG: hypothetical protein QM718_11785 [Steroidobacteraceae bacterium]